MITAAHLEDPFYEIIVPYQIQELPPLEELSEWLQKKPDGLAFPVSHKHFMALKDTDLDHFLEPQVCVTCHFVDDRLHNFVELPAYGCTKRSFIHLWESLVGDMLSLFCSKAVVFDRDSNLDLYAESKRSDRLFFVRGFPVLRGEEEGVGKSTSVLLAKLREKTWWSYGDVPYLLAYAAAGHVFTFVALFQQIPSAGVQVQELVTLDLSNKLDRVKLLTVLFNVARLMSVLAELCEEYDAEPDHTPVIQARLKMVQLCMDQVVKTYNTHSTYTRVFKIYEAIRDIPRVETCISTGVRERKSQCDSAFSLAFWPRLSFRQKAYPEKELVRALCQISETLCELHRKGWVHRDVHWMNIGMYGSDWYLMDFDEAEQAPCKTAHAVGSGNHAPEMLQGRHSYPVDVWSIGHLIATSPSKNALSPGLEELRDACLEKLPGERPKVEAVASKLNQLMQAY